MIALSIENIKQLNNHFHRGVLTMPPTDYQVSGRCPVCGERMHVTRLECGNCLSALEGHFQLGPFQNLSSDQLQFLEVFIRCRGQNKAIQELLNISYPTVIKKLDELIVALGYEPALVAGTNEVEQPEQRRREVLEMLRQNKISSAQAQQMLAGLTPGRSAEIGRNNQIGE
jgi:hypothetical protein